MSWYSQRDALGFLVVWPAIRDFAKLAAQAAGEADEALGVFGEETLADARLAIKAVQGGLGGDADQVPVALLVFGEHEQVVVLGRLGGVSARWSSVLHT